MDRRGGRARLSLWSRALGRGLKSGQEGGMWVGGRSRFYSLCGLFVISRLTQRAAASPQDYPVCSRLKALSFSLGNSCVTLGVQRQGCPAKLKPTRLLLCLLSSPPRTWLLLGSPMAVSLRFSEGAFVSGWHPASLLLYTDGLPRSYSGKSLHELASAFNRVSNPASCPCGNLTTSFPCGSRASVMVDVLEQVQVLW